jgi:hypothetical protein
MLFRRQEDRAVLRALLKFILVIVIVVAAAAFFMGYRWGGGSISSVSQRVSDKPAPVGTAGTADSARARAREAGADIGEKIAVGAEKASESLAEAQLTAKVKSKIALDDTLDGARISVESEDQRVTLTGTVIDAAQRARALSLARETEGVSAVVDHLSVGTR